MKEEHLQRLEKSIKALTAIVTCFTEVEAMRLRNQVAMSMGIQLPHTSTDFMNCLKNYGFVKDPPPQPEKGKIHRIK